MHNKNKLKLHLLSDVNSGCVYMFTRFYKCVHVSRKKMQKAWNLPASGTSSHLFAK